MRRNSIAALVIALCALVAANCSTKSGTRQGNGAIPQGDQELDKRFLNEGFITDDIFRVVIVSGRETENKSVQEIQSKAKIRARISLERWLLAENKSNSRAARTAIANLVEDNGLLYKKEIDHKRYEVYYFEVRKKDLKNSLKNIGQ